MSNTKNLYTAALEQAFHHANDFLGRLDNDPVDVSLDYEQMKTLWDWELPVEGKTCLRGYR
jgi:hypothetical protein